MKEKEEVVVRANLADLPVNLVVELSQSKGNLQKQAEILSKAVEEAKKKSKIEKKDDNKG